MTTEATTEVTKEATTKKAAPKKATKAKAKKAAPKKATKAKKAAPKKATKGKAAAGKPGVLQGMADLLRGSKHLTVQELAEKLAAKYDRPLEAVLCTVKQQISKLPQNAKYGIKAILREKVEGERALRYYAK